MDNSLVLCEKALHHKYTSTKKIVACTHLSKPIKLKNGVNQFCLGKLAPGNKNKMVANTKNAKATNNAETFLFKC